MGGMFSKPKVAKPEPVVQATDPAVDDAATQEAKKLGTQTTPTLLTGGTGANSDDTLLDAPTLGAAPSDTTLSDTVANAYKKTKVMLG